MDVSHDFLMGARRLNPVPEKNIFFFLYILFFFVANFRSQLKKSAYRKTGTQDPSGTLEKPKNQDPGP